MSAFIDWIKKFWAPMLLAMSCSIFLIAIFFPSLHKITYGFSAYYTAAHLVAEHRGGSIFYDDHTFQTEVERLTDGQAVDIYWANPPTTALMLLPLAKLSITKAHIVWLGILLIALFLAVVISGLSIFKTPFRTTVFYLATSILFISVPIAKNFQYGQVYVLLLAFYAIALLALNFGIDWLAAFFLAFALALKASGLPLFVLLLLRGRWRLVLWTIIVLIGFGLLSIPLIGCSTWRNYLFYALPRFLRDPVIAVAAYQTVPGLVRHLFAYDHTWNTRPLVNSPALAFLAGPLISFVLVGLAGFRSRKTSLTWTFCTGLILSVILVPAAEQHHYVLLFPAFLLAIYSPFIPKVPLYISAALIVLPIDSLSAGLSSGWWALLAYPRLYGAILLFVLLQYYRAELPSLEQEGISTDAFSHAQ